jgi:hypothetical protein
MTITAAAHLYDTTPRTVHRWKEIGDEKGRACPWDRPAEMPEWWQRCMERRCPDAVLKAADGNEAEADPISGKVPPETDSGGGENGSQEGVGEGVPAASPELVGYGHALERLRRMEAALGEAYTAAVTGGDVSKAEALRRQWSAVSEELRKAEMAAVELRRKGESRDAEEMVSKSRVCALIDSMLRAVPRSLELDLLHSRPEFARVFKEAEEEPQLRLWTDTVRHFVQTALGRLRESRFADRLEEPA